MLIGGSSNLLNSCQTKLEGSEFSLSVFVVHWKVVDRGCQTRFCGAPHHQHYCCDIADPRSTRVRPRSSKSTQQMTKSHCTGVSWKSQMPSHAWVGWHRHQSKNLQLRNIGTSKVVSTCTKIRLFSSRVKSVLLYGAETWKTMKTTIKKVQTFINRPSTMQTCGSVPTSYQPRTRAGAGDGDGLGTPWRSQLGKPRGKRSSGTPEGSWREEGQQTPGDETSMLTSRRWERPVDSWR